MPSLNEPTVVVLRSKQLEAIHQKTDKRDKLGIQIGMSFTGILRQE